MLPSSTDLCWVVCGTDLGYAAIRTGGGSTRLCSGSTRCGTDLPCGMNAEKSQSAYSLYQNSGLLPLFRRCPVLRQHVLRYKALGSAGQSTVWSWGIIQVRYLPKPVLCDALYRHTVWQYANDSSCCGEMLHGAARLPWSRMCIMVCTRGS